MPNNRNLRDAQLAVTRALPASTTAVNSNGIKLGNSPSGDFVAEGEFKVVAPAVTTSQLPDAKVMVYTLQSDNDPTFGSPTTVVTLGTQTGAGGAGAATAEYRYRPPSNCEDYFRLVVTPSASGTGDATGATATMEWVS